MSKTYSIQVEKARVLAKGLRENLELVKTYGVTSEALDALERDAAETEQADNELDALRAEVSAKASAANQKLNGLREQIQSLKLIVKKHFDQPRWEALGVPDKR